MYFWLFVAVFVVWAWLVGGSVVAARESKIGGFTAFCAVGALTGVAALVVLFAAPYWVAVYQILLQPG